MAKRQGTPLWEVLELARDLVKSPSEITTWDKCLRKGFGSYALGFREPSTPATERGNVVHEHLEGYLEAGSPIDTQSWEGRIAASGHKYLPVPGTGLVEAEFLIPRDGFFYYGFIDWIVKPEYRIRKVKDHKTTSDFKYAKPEEVLRKDPQVLVYGAATAVGCFYRIKPDSPILWSDGWGSPGDPIDLEWIYYLAAKGKKHDARSVPFQLTEAELLAGLADLDHRCLEQIEHRKRTKSILTLFPTQEACFAYGKPCHLKHLCTDLKTSIGAMMAQTKDELLASLKTKALGQAAPPGVPLPPPPPGVTPPAGAAPAPAVPALPSLPSIPSPTAGSPATATAAATAPAPAAPALPSLPSLPSPAAAAPAAPAAPVAAPAAPAVPALPALPPVPGAPAAPAVAPPAGAPPIDPAVLAAAAAEGKGKGKKAPAAPAVTPPPETTPGPIGIIYSDGSTIGTLYVDCIRTRTKGEPHNQPSDPLDFKEIAKACHAGIREQTGQAHYRLFDFGKGLGMWTEAIRLWLNANPQASVYVDTSANDAKDALEVLLASASSIVRAIR